MAAIAAILSGIVRSAWRDVRTLGSIVGNNLIAVVILMMANEPPDRPSSAAFFLFLIGFLFLFPLSADLLREVPAERLRVWPLSRRQRIALQLAALALNPVLLIALVFAIVTRQLAVGLALVVAGAIILAATEFFEMLLRRAPSFNPLRLMPRVPGRLGGLIQNQIRQYLGALDVYFAALLAIGGIVYCFFTPNPQPGARTVIGLLVVLFMSTLAQCQFGYDSAAEEDRYRLMPLSGRQILLAKDAAWFSIVLMLAWPFHLLACMASAAVALAIGHDTAVRNPIAQRRWRFAEGRLGPTGILQIMFLASAGAAVEHFGWLMSLLFFGAYVASLLWYAREWDRRL